MNNIEKVKYLFEEMEEKDLDIELLSLNLATPKKLNKWSKDKKVRKLCRHEILRREKKAAKKKKKKDKEAVEVESVPDDELTKSDKTAVVLSSASKADNIDVDALLSKVVSWVTRQSGLNYDESGDLKAILMDSKERFEAMLTVLSIKRVERLYKILSFADAIEEELFDINRIKNAKTGQLIRMYGLANNSVNDTLSMLQEILIGPKREEGKQLAIFLDNRQQAYIAGDTTGHKPVIEDKQSRAKLQGIFDMLEDKIQNGDKDKDVAETD